MSKELCGYCKKRPLVNRVDASTCGHPICSRKNNNVVKRKQMAKERGEYQLKNLPTKTRECLKCGKKFESEGNFICANCTLTNREICDSMIYRGDPGGPVFV